MCQQVLSDVTHTMLSLNPMASAGIESMCCVLARPSIKPRTILKHNGVIHTRPVEMKIGTAFLELNLAVCLKTTDAPTL